MLFQVLQNLQGHGRGLLMAVFIVILYWMKEFMELFLRLVYGVDRRYMYVPVPQNAPVDLSTIRPSPMNFQRRGDLFYYVFHFATSMTLATIFYCLALYASSSADYYTMSSFGIDGFLGN
ncbi:unnamed protein product [Allacma fusca]|uniref:Uncharacterized protein n=1 Tax=Allacma fusca TaxID=39272 RepID=A0A8J2KPP1_9HEXA|nr:unnamed protein product [Allacma fusca]